MQLVLPVLLFPTLSWSQVVRIVRCTRPAGCPSGPIQMATPSPTPSVGGALAADPSLVDRARLWKESD